MSVLEANTSGHKPQSEKHEEKKKSKRWNEANEGKREQRSDKTTNDDKRSDEDNIHTTQRTRWVNHFSNAVLTPHPK